MLSIAVVEDCELDRKILCGFIDRYSAESDISFRLFEFRDGAELVEEYSADTDIIFMDIEMKHLNGMESAGQIRTIDEKVMIIFTTNISSYAIQSYSVNASNYLLKPLSYQAVKKELDKVLMTIERRKGTAVCIRNQYGIYLIRTKDIFYVETSSRRLIIHTRDRNISCQETMQKMEKKLSGLPFFRCHKAFLINLEYVRQINGTEIIVGDDKLYISKHRKKELMDALASWWGELL